MGRTVIRLLFDLERTMLEGSRNQIKICGNLKIVKLKFLS